MSPPISAPFHKRILPALAIPCLSLGLLVSAPSSASGSDAKPAVTLKQVAEGFTAPTIVTSLPDGSGSLLIVDQIGTVHVLGKDGRLKDDPFLDLRSKMTKLNQGFDERGLLGLALHPKFNENRKLYVYYSVAKRAGAPEDWDHTSRLSEFKVTEGSWLKVDPASEKVVLEIDQPYGNHNGGRIAFGPEGFLYVAMGDGGNANDVGKRPPEGNGQNLQTLLGKILRIDVDNGNPYQVPKDNPFADGKGGLPEIYAYGFRNPWGMSFDRKGLHDLFVADVGQTLFEEVNIVVKGGNYGWSVREGFHCFNPKDPKSPPDDCPKVGPDGKPMIDPILEYKNLNGFRKDPDAGGISVAGGYVYRGKALPQLQGRYVFGDWSKQWALPQGLLFVATRPSSGGGKWTMEPLKVASHPGDNLGMYVWTFGEDDEGELYLTTNKSNSLIGKTGKVFKLVPAE